MPHVPDCHTKACPFSLPSVSLIIDTFDSSLKKWPEMREELATIKEAIDAAALPADADILFSRIWSDEHSRFHVQETHILDYKETIPMRFTDEYGSSIIRLCLGFHNTFGGLIIFGVKDRVLTVQGVSSPPDVEAINRVLTDCAGFSAECLTKEYKIGREAEVKTIAVLLVPRRGFEKPVRLLRSLSRYQAGTLWVRDRAEVLEAKPKHFPLLYSSRNSLPSDASDITPTPIHRSLPPSPATLKVFIGREGLLIKLWDWLIFGDQPRLYLHGPGGSGKSTLAFEFARLLTETGQQINLENNGHLDYVIYLSAKETELNPITAREQLFALKQFDSSATQFAQIVYHSGFLEERIAKQSSESQLLSMIDDLFRDFNGLIVIDDIDALHRKKTESGEETLLFKALLCKSRTRILYTLRFPPANVHNSSEDVPGLNEGEFFAFIEACSAQFDVRPPDGQHIPKILEATKGLPLLVETLVGLRKFCGNYPDALATFSQKGGEEARRYLYQREYDRLDREGRSRQVLAGLVLLGEAVSFSTLCTLFQFSTEQVRDALSESASVFLSTLENTESGETLYQLTPPSVPFIKNVSEGLSYFGSLKKSVDHFSKIATKVSPDEAALIVNMERLIRQKRFTEIVSLATSFPSDDPVLVNPKVRSLLGQSYAELGPDYREKAREWFRAAEGLNFRDAFMMRRWYNLEFLSGYNLGEAERICNVMLKDNELSARVRSEFLSKLANCLFEQANGLIYVNREKAISLLKGSMDNYLEALWVGERAQGIDLELTLSWIERPIQKFMAICADSIEDVFLFIDWLVDKKHDVHESGIRIYLQFLLDARIPANRKDVRNKLKGLCTKSLKKVAGVVRPPNIAPGFSLIKDTLEDIKMRAEQIERASEP